MHSLDAFSHPNRICRLGGFAANSYVYYPVIIIGAGESGIAMGCRLKQALGFDQFRIFDRQSGVGGTWYINTYPGVACDVPAVFYSYSFFPNHRWTKFYPTGSEIVKYLIDACSEFEITDKIQCNTSVQGCKWLPDEQLWEVELTHMFPGTGDLSIKERNTKIENEGVRSVYLCNEKVRAKVVVSAVGALVEPRAWPVDIPGLDVYKGDMFHSARWRHDVDFTNKNVVVIGTGCSAAQFVPLLPKPPYNAKSVTQLMRSPPWVRPRPSPPLVGDQMWEKYSITALSWVPGLSQLIRILVFLITEYDTRLFGGSEFSKAERKKMEKDLIHHLRRITPEKYHTILTPDYGVGCKRLVYDAAWLRSLHDATIDLTTMPLKSIQPHSVILGGGQVLSATAENDREIPADIIVLANGFDTTRWLHPLDVIGKRGKSLEKEMDARGGPQAYQGTAMDGFPNFFFLFGPNTATGHSSVILASENMVSYSLKFIKEILKGNVNTFEVKREAEEAFTHDVQRALKKTVWSSGGCLSWYQHNGWNSTLYPYTQIWFGLRCMFPIWSDWNVNYTRKGIWRRRGKWAIRILLLALLTVWIYTRHTHDWKLSIRRSVVKALQQLILLILKSQREGTVC